MQPASPLQGLTECHSKPRVPEPAVAVSYTLGFAASRLRRFLMRHLQFRNRDLKKKPGAGSEAFEGPGPLFLFWLPAPGFFFNFLQRECRSADRESTGFPCRRSSTKDQFPSREERQGARSTVPESEASWGDSHPFQPHASL